jgi:hypothetical protein
MRDFKSFFKQFDNRRGKNFTETFPELADWYSSIPNTISIKQISTISGDSSNMTIPFSNELKQLAEQEGWVLHPQNSNPGSENFVDKE